MIIQGHISISRLQTQTSRKVTLNYTVLLSNGLSALTSNPLSGHVNPLPATRRPLPKWNIYVVRSTPAKHLGIVEARDADAAIEEAIKEFEKTSCRGRSG
jgi:hypothetical protein